MSSRTTKSQQPSQPVSQQTGPPTCDFCHAKPRYGTHPYCGKNCATQAASLCHQCHVKPKHGTHNFCGKKCAALANANKPGASQPGGGASASTTNGTTNQPAMAPSKGVSAGNTNGSGYPAKKGWKAPPAQQASFVSTTLPVPFQVAPLLNHIQSLATTALSNISNLPSAPANGHPPAYGSIVNETLAAVLNLPTNMSQAESYPSGQQTSYPKGQQAYPSGQQAPYPNSQQTYPQQVSHAPDQQATYSMSKGQPSQTQVVQPQAECEDEEERECRIPGCGQPVHETSEYCSARHRDEATLGLEEACIMCLKLPQSETDYFCGRICREEALSKLVEV